MLRSAAAPEERKLIPMHHQQPETKSPTDQVAATPVRDANTDRNQQKT